MHAARCTGIVAALLACVCACDDDVVTPPPANVWRSSWSHPLPNGATIRGIGGYTEFNQWAVGDGGLVARYRGFELRGVASPTTHTLRDVTGFSETSVFMVGDHGTILGPGLAIQASGTSENLYSLFGFSATNLVAVGANGTILANDGGGWSAVPSPISADLFDVWMLENGEGVAVGAGGVVLRTIGGGPWQLEPSFTATDLNAVWADKPRDWFIVGDAGEIWQDRGAGWTAMASPRTDDFYDITGSDSAFVWAIGDADSILFYDQVSWKPIAPNPSGHLDAGWATICPLLAASPQDATRDARHCSNTYFAGAGRFFARYTLLGTYDVYSDALTYEDLNAIHGLSNGDMYAVGNKGALLHNAGGEWTDSPTGIDDDLFDVFAVSALDVFLVGEAGRIVRGVDGAWSTLTSGTGETLRGVWAADATHVFVVGDAGTLLASNGVSWAPESAPALDYTDVWGVSANDVFAVARGGAIVERIGGVWTSVASPVASDLFAVWGTSTDRMFAAGANGALLRREAGVWQPMDSGVLDDFRGLSGSGSSVWAVGTAGAVVHFEGTTRHVEPRTPVDAFNGLFVRSGGLATAVGSTANIVQFRLESL